LQVTKAVNWNGITVDNSQVFEICIQGPSYGTLNCKSTGYNGGNLNWSILIPGTYTVTETSPGNAWTVAITGSPVNVPVDGSQASASVTNTHKRGILQITKVVNWQNTPTDPSKTFLVCITGPSYGSPGCQASDYDGSTLTWNDLLPGNYTVSETNPGDIWQVQLPSNPVNVLANGSITTATVTNTRKAVRLEVGWNLISLPVTPIDPATAAALSKINGAYDLVFAYLGCTPSDPWKKFDPDAPAYSNTLLSVGVSNGYWIQANQVKMFTLDGTQPASTSIPLCTGWNMIGYPSWTIRTIDQALVGIAGKYTLVYTYVASDVADPWKKFNPNSPVGNDLTTMQPWAGYWILMTQPATLVINQ
jgi:hypothetical protein